MYSIGGIACRPGLRFVINTWVRGRLVPFEFNKEQVYLFVYIDVKIDIYKNSINIAAIISPWSEARLSSLPWAQSSDTLLLVNLDVAA